MWAHQKHVYLSHSQGYNLSAYSFLCPQSLASVQGCSWGLLSFLPPEESAYLEAWSPCLLCRSPHPPSCHSPCPPASQPANQFLALPFFFPLFSHSCTFFGALLSSLASGASHARTQKACAAAFLSAPPCRALRLEMRAGPHLNL